MRITNADANTSIRGLGLSQISVFLLSRRLAIMYLGRSSDLTQRRQEDGSLK